MPFNSSVLNIDAEATASSIAATLRKQILMTVRRKGVVVAVSGGIDSSVCATLCARAVGKERVLALSLPERDSSRESASLATLLTENLGITHLTEDITPVLEAAGCYRRQEEAIRSVFPEFGSDWKFKVVIPSILQGERLNISRLEVEDPHGKKMTSRLSPSAYLHLIAATNFKQRVRAMTAYYHADRLNYAVCGTPNLLEYDQGFYVKGGDGLADVKPIAHLYKTQVYDLARHLGIPDKIVERKPTTDTFSLAQSQEEFFFSLPYDKMDVCLFAHNHGVSAADTAEAIGLTEEQVQRVFVDIEAKRRHAEVLNLAPLLFEETEVNI